MPAKFYRLSIILIVALQLWLHVAVDAVAADKPNLVVIMTDEHNFRTLGCYRALLPAEQAFVWGDGIAVETPHIDSIAKNGAICDRFYAASPVCTPSRASFFTGLYPQNTGVLQNNEPLHDDVLTFAEILRRNGYRTGYAGKWHLDGPAKPGWTPARQFGFQENTMMFNRGHWKQLEQADDGPRVKGGNNYNVEGADQESFTTDFLADRTIEFIKDHRSEAFCFVLSLPDPHGPNSVRPPYDTMYDSLDFQRPASASATGTNLPKCAVSPEKPQMENMGKYFGMVKCIDDNVGKILQALKDADVADNTIVVFTSDHGDMCGEHGRTNKGIPLEASARIPFVVSHPGKISPGTQVQQALSNVDFQSTILALMDVANPSENQGRDASTLFTTGTAPTNWEDVAISRNAGGTWLMAVSSRHKLIVSSDSDPCLFDLQEDPSEMTNIFDQPSSRETVRQLAKALADYASACNEQHADKPSVRADLTWAIEGGEDYVRPNRPAAQAGKKRR